MAEVKFEVDVANIDETYGLTVFVQDSSLPEPADDDVVPCYFLVLKGPLGKDASEVAEAFGQCHQEAMDSVGLEGQVTEEQFAQKLEDSVELAGELMVRHGFEALDVDTVDPGMMQDLFDPDGDEQDPAFLN